MNDNDHLERFKVRDYECDMQGVVNNSIYQNYLEHARHEYLHSLGLDFAALTRQGVNLVVVRAELDYRSPLRSGDRFCVRTHLLRQSRLRFVFIQNIVREPDDCLVLSGRIIGTALDQRGRPQLPAEIEGLLAAAAHGGAGV